MHVVCSLVSESTMSSPPAKSPCVDPHRLRVIKKYIQNKKTVTNKAFAVIVFHAAMTTQSRHVYRTTTSYS